MTTAADPVHGGRGFEDGTHHWSEEKIMQRHHEGLPAAATVEQAIILAQLQILRRVERERNGR